MERYIQNPVKVKLRDGTRDAYLHDENFPPLGLRVKLHHSQEEFYAPAVAIRYRLPCHHGYVTLDLWHTSSPVLTRGVQFDASKRGSPLLFTVLTLQFLENIRDTEICFLRKVQFNQQNLRVLKRNLAPAKESRLSTESEESVEGYVRF